MKKLIFLIIIFSAAINIAQSEHAPLTNSNQIVIKDTELKLLYSEEVKDTFYLYVKLPKGYSESDKSYPVLYLLDGDIAFPMATSIVRYQQYPKLVPDIIIIGIGYGSMMNDHDTNYRSRDYNLPEVVRQGFKGGGDKYMEFLANELIPFIDKNYRTTPGKRIISGHSLSGQYAIYLLLNNPMLFSGYIASSPHMINSIDFLLEQETKKISSLEKVNARLFISRGSEEPYSTYGKPISLLLDMLNDRNYDGIRIEYKIFDEGSHFVCPPEAMSHGLKYVFKE